MKRLIVICENRRDYEAWCISVGLPAFCNFIHSWTPRTRADQFRGLSETNTAFLWLARPDLGKNAKAILDVMLGLGAKQFDNAGPAGVAEIREWLGYIEKTREKKLEEALGEALGMLRTISMFMLKYPEADTVASKVREWGELLK